MHELMITDVTHCYCGHAALHRRVFVCYCGFASCRPSNSESIVGYIILCTPLCGLFCPGIDTQVQGIDLGFTFNG
jgi:hypothetical protein